MFTAEAIQLNVVVPLAAGGKGYNSRSDGGTAIRMKSGARDPKSAGAMNNN